MKKRVISTNYSHLTGVFILLVTLATVTLSAGQIAKEDNATTAVFEPSLTAAEAARIAGETTQISFVNLAPDGQWVTYRTTRWSVTANERTEEYLLQRLPRGSEIPVPPPTRLPARPLGWHPKGQELLMVLNPDAANPNRPVGLVLYSVETGEIRPIPIRDTGPNADKDGKRPRITEVNPTDLVWSPSGRYLAFTAPLAKKAVIDPRRGISGDLWQATPPRAIFVLEIATGEVKQLTSEADNVLGGLDGKFDWSPDERSLAAPFVSPVAADDIDLMLVSYPEGKVQKLVVRPGTDNSPSWSPDGQWIAFATDRGEGLSFRGTLPAMVPAKGGGVIDFPKEGTPHTGWSNSWWSADSRSLYFSAAWNMTGRIARAKREGTTISLVKEPNESNRMLRNPDYRNYSVSSDGSLMAYTVGSATTPNDLYTIAIDQYGSPTGQPRRLTDVNPNFTLGSGVRSEQIQWPSKDGKFTIHGLLLTPASAYGPDGRILRRLPTVVEHTGGGSVSRGLGGSFHNGASLVLAVRGYAILRPSPRGRPGYDGLEYQNALTEGKGRNGTGHEDTMAGLDFLIAKGITDADRVGVMGHSFGAALTLYSIGHTGRFKASVVHEGVMHRWVNQFDFTDFAVLNMFASWEAMNFYNFGMRKEGPALQRLRLADSPIHNFSTVTTPTLLSFGVHSEARGTGNVFFNLLRLRDVPVSYFVYDEGHGILRPAARALDMTRTIEWLDHWVRGIPYPDKEREKEYNAWKAAKKNGSNASAAAKPQQK